MLAVTILLLGWWRDRGATWGLVPVPHSSFGLQLPRLAFSSQARFSCSLRPAWCSPPTRRFPALPRSTRHPFLLGFPCGEPGTDLGCQVPGSGRSALSERPRHTPRWEANGASPFWLSWGCLVAVQRWGVSPLGGPVPRPAGGECRAGNRVSTPSRRGRGVRGGRWGGRPATGKWFAPFCYPGLPGPSRVQDERYRRGGLHSGFWYCPDSSTCFATSNAVLHAARNRYSSVS